MNPASRKVPLVTGLALHVLEWDSPADHTVVLLHGFLDFAWTWQQLVDAGLAGRFHVVAPDLRGHGDSDRVGAGGYYHYADYLADVADLVDQLGRKTVSIVGHSMGGSVAAYYTGTRPERVHRLALLEGLGPPETTAIGPERVAAWIGAWKRVATAGTPRPLASIDEAAERLCRHDALLEPELARRMAYFKDARSVVLDGAAHMMQRHQPAALAVLLGDFLGG